jgi:tetratricopeptide (TPR) repeat protein
MSNSEKILIKDQKLFDRALHYQNSGDYLKALNIYKPLSFKYQNKFEISLNLGMCYFGLSNYTKAIEIFHTLHEKYPSNTQLLNYCAVSYLHLNHFELALDFFKLLVNAEPNNIDGWVNLTYTSNLLKKNSDSLYYATQALSLNPHEARLYSNLGSSLLTFNRYSDAQTCYETALELDPSHVNAMTNLGTINDKLCNYKESIDHYRNALSFLTPNTAEENEVLYRMSFPTLAIGDIQSGWDLYERGFNIAGLRGRLPNREFSKPKWNGQNIADKTLLIWREQGIGDELWFFSLIGNVLPICNNIIIECDKRLVSLLQRSFPKLRS